MSFMQGKVNLWNLFAPRGGTNVTFAGMRVHWV